MLHGIRIVVVVPAFNEERRIGRVLAGMPACVDSIIVVDDASTDGTRAVVLSAHDARIRLVAQVRRRGVGHAIATGYARALSEPGAPDDVFIVMAGDAQMDPADIPSLVMPISQKIAAYVKGDRFRWPNVRAIMPAQRYLAGRVLSWLTSRAVGFPVSDSQCGYTAISRRACERLDLDGLWPSYGYPNDLLGQLAMRKIPVAEVPVRPIYAGEESKLRPYHLAPIAVLLARAWFRRIRVTNSSETERSRESEPLARTGFAG